MILQSLASYYDRLGADPNTGIAMPGYSSEKISFAMVLGPRGDVMDVSDLREQDGRKKSPRPLLVPASFKRPGSQPKAFTLWDNTGFALGAVGPDSADSKKKLQVKFAAFKARQAEFAAHVEDEGVQALCAFLDRWDPVDAPKLRYWEDMASANIVFRLDGERRFIHERPKVRAALTSGEGTSNAEDEGFCLVSGKRAPIARLHPAIKGVLGAQTSGASLSSYNLSAFESYGKEQNFNAPVSEEATFAYATALNHLLRRESRQRVQVGDATTVFWTERASPAEDFMAGLIGGEQPETQEMDAEDRALVQKLRSLLDAIRMGKHPPELGDPGVPFYILGLGPNASRLVVRFWKVSTVGELAANIGRHFADLQIAHGPRDPDFPQVFQLLLSVAALRKADNIPPRLGGEMMRAVLSGSAYPMALLQAAVRRNLAEQSVTYHRAALIKACLNRHQRFFNPSEKEITVNFDSTREDIGYRLGAVFAALEKIQEDAQPEINSTIRDRFYGAASSNPVTVFSNLMKLKNHHLAKLAPGGRVNFERLVARLMGPVRDFPATLPLVEQGRFAIGYYHLRQDLFTKGFWDAPWLN